MSTPLTADKSQPSVRDFFLKANPNESRSQVCSSSSTPAIPLVTKEEMGESEVEGIEVENREMEDSNLGESETGENDTEESDHFEDCN